MIRFTDKKSDASAAIIFVKFKMANDIYIDILTKHSLKNLNYENI